MTDPNSAGNSGQSVSPRNRGRYVIELGDQWRLHAKLAPGMQFIGTIQRGMHIGALAVAVDGTYWCVSGKRFDRLIQRKVEAALDAFGPRSTNQGGLSGFSPRSTSLDDPL